MYALHNRSDDRRPSPDPALITPLEIARALFDASERIVLAPTLDHRAEAIEANTALWLGVSSAAKEHLVDLPEAVCRRLHRVAQTVARRTLTVSAAELTGGSLAMRLVRLNDLACRAMAPPTPRRHRMTAPPGLH